MAAFRKPRLARRSAAAHHSRHGTAQAATQVADERALIGGACGHASAEATCGRLQEAALGPPQRGDTHGLAQLDLETTCYLQTPLEVLSMR